MHVTISVTSQTGSDAYLPGFNFLIASWVPRFHLVALKYGDRDQQQPLEWWYFLASQSDNSLSA